MVAHKLSSKIELRGGAIRDADGANLKFSVRDLYMEAVRQLFFYLKFSLCRMAFVASYPLQLEQVGEAIRSTF